MYQFVELSLFTKRWKELELIDRDLRELQNAIMQTPNSAVDLGAGLHKIRQGIAGQGKRGGIRVIYADHRKYGFIFLLVCFSKNDIENITSEQQRQLTIASQVLMEMLLNRRKR